MISKKNGYIISVDLGTSSVRACLVDSSLKILKQIDQPVSLISDAPGKAVQDAQTIIQTAYNCTREIFAWSQANRTIPDAISFSNASGSLVCLDSGFNPISPALTYADLRASQESQWLIDKYGHAYFKRTATPVHASYWLPKFLWLQNSDYDFSQCQYFCTIKDLMVYQLTGQFVTDKSNAVATGMCDVTTGNWDERHLTISGVGAEQLPEIRPTTAILEPIHANKLLSIKPPPDLKIVLGAMDGVLSSLGAGAFKPGQVTTMIGSSGACRVAATSPLIDQEILKTWSYPLDDQIWIRGGAMNNGGLVTKWLVRNFSASKNTSEKAYQELFEQAERIEPSANGLIFLPYLFGERAPIYDENARGVYFGLLSNHHQAHFGRAGLEGILFALYSIYEIINPHPDDDVEVIATGGYIRSDLMLQIQADIFGLPINISKNLEGSVIGAASLALKSCGVIKSYDELSEFMASRRQILPDKTRHKKYQATYRQFKELYKHLQPMFQHLSEFGNG